MNPPESTLTLQRRRLLLFAAGTATLALAGCGGDGGNDEPAAGPSPAPSPSPSPSPTPTPSPSPSPSPAGPSGKIVYHNSWIGVYDWASGKDVVTFEHGMLSGEDPAVSRSGIITTVHEEGNDSFGISFYDLQGVLQRTESLPRAGFYPFPMGAARFNADETLLAVAVDELRSPDSMDRVNRTLVYSWPDLQLVGALEGLEEPCWAVDDLLLLDPTTSGVHRIRQIGTDFIDQGALPGVVVSPTHGGWDVSYDGRYIVTVDVSEGSWHSVRAYDLQTGTSYLAVSDPNSATWAVTISPDGRYLALISLHLETHVLFVVPFDGANTVTLDSSKPLDGTTLADVSGRIGWCE